MANSENLLGSTSKDVFAQSILQPVSLLDTSGIAGLHQALSQPSNPLLLTDPLAKVVEPSSPSLLNKSPQALSSLDSPTVFNNTAATLPLTRQAGIDPLTGTSVATQSVRRFNPTPHRSEANRYGSGLCRFKTTRANPSNSGR